MVHKRIRSLITDYRYTRFLILLPVFTFALSLGYLHGRLLSAAPAHISLQHDSRPAVPTVLLTGIRNGRLNGVITGDARLILGKTPVIGSGTFSIVAGSLLTNVIEIDIPVGARFVASKRGKKYYPVTSASAQGLSPENRIYFDSEAKAQAAGFIR